MNYQFIDELHRAVEAQRELMFQTERYIWAHPETGYKEWETEKYMAERFKELGYELVHAGNIPGFYTDLDTGRPGPYVLIMAELDSVICASHPESNPETGAVHACGHHAQCAAMLGAAAALKNSNLLSLLSGKIRFMAVPAEELIEIEYRESLRKKGIIKYLGGKVEFMYRGYMNGVDVAIMLHTGTGENKITLGPGQNGCIAKKLEFRGKPSHAGGAPQDGINALYAANVALNAANALRETFVDNDHIRFHPIITGKTGSVNAIPDIITMESYVRGASLEAIKSANSKINRAMAAGAAAMGAQLHICDSPGYMPVNNDVNLYNLAKQVTIAIAGEENLVESNHWGGGCTDMGDVSCVIPAIHPHGSGASGTSHGMDYTINDPESACTLAAKYLVGMACALLENGGAAAKYIKENSQLLYPNFDEFFKAIDSLFLDRNVVTYEENGDILLKYQK